MIPLGISQNDVARLTILALEPTAHRVRDTRVNSRERRFFKKILEHRSSSSIWRDGVCYDFPHQPVVILGYIHKGGMSTTRSLSIIRMPLSSCNMTLEDGPPDKIIRVGADGCKVVEGWSGERRVAEGSELISARNFRVTGC